MKVPLEKSNNHIVIPIETDFGIKKFCLDTGVDKTILCLSSLGISASNHLNITTKKFIATDHNFGDVTLHLFNFPS